ncbi:MAG: hypothetical protein K0S45_2057 [Nitrospira sp.]|jgi:hypothetical protein|nr:hypothetical protein [Nitrospira sp.]
MAEIHNAVSRPTVEFRTDAVPDLVDVVVLGDSVAVGVEVRQLGPSPTPRLDTDSPFIIFLSGRSLR